ncbi:MULTISPECIES: AraC family transcriptional regulator [unclassified Aureimonas]|uniref:AraC family transcriptional regulator n=1 Tax=unclassified Aureimonas TaxID=2615206 RepID=UPI000A3FDE43|nr:MULTISPECIES: AraC family transcriptional regulator [unclassified Aureimonas]
MGKDRLRLWRDGGVFGKLELLSARCFRHRYPAHSHDEFVIAAFRRGAQRHQIVRHTGIAYAGTVMIIPPGAVHTGEAAERDGGWEYCAFYPEASVLERIADEWLGPGTGTLDFGRDVIFEDRVMTGHLLNAHRIAEMSPDPIERQCALFDAFGLLIRRYGQRTREPRTSPILDANIAPAIEFLREHFDRPLIVREIARVVDFSEFHFMRLFRAKTGLTVHAYLTQLRLQRAKDLLQQGTRPVDIAVDVGFCDQSHMIKRFRAHFGVTPGDFASACR